MTNWRTSLTAFLAAITSALTLAAALPAQLGDLSTIIPEEWKPLIIKIGIVSTILLRVINGLVAKDRVVSGNGTFAAPTIVNDGSGKNVFPLILACGLALGTTACSSLDRYERSYGIQYQDATGRHIGGTVRLAPRAGLAK
jgi:hypothetical protein